jgi:hypothetical protein
MPSSHRAEGVMHAVPLPRSVRAAAPGLVAAERQEMRDTAGAVSREQSEPDDGRRVSVKESEVGCGELANRTNPLVTGDRFPVRFVPHRTLRALGRINRAERW